MLRPLKIVLTLFFCLPLIAIALPEDTHKVMQIHANSTLFDYKKGTDVYEGDVNITQGSTRLKADRVTTQKNKKHKMEEAIAYGSQHSAEYWTLPKTGDLELHASAKIIKFYPIKSLVMLEGDVVVTQGENSFQGPSIIYNIKDQTVTSPPSKNGRSTIIINPKQFQ